MKKSPWITELLYSIRLKSVVVILLLTACISSSIYVIKENEIGVLKTIGKVTEITPPGLHFKFPYPIQSVDAVSLSRVHSLEIGFVDPEKQRDVQKKKDTLMLTRDENLVWVNAIVEWKIIDPKSYMLVSKEPQQLLRDTVLACLRASIGNSSIDYVLTDGKTNIQNDAKKQLDQYLNQYNIGIQVLSLRIQNTSLPPQVLKSFQEVADAKEQKAIMINKAQEYRNQKLSAAQVESNKLLQEAEAYYEERINNANTEVGKFNSLYEQYKISKEVTKTRLYLEALEEILPNSNLYIIDEDSKELISLPIDKTGGAANE